MHTFRERIFFVCSCNLTPCRHQWTWEYFVCVWLWRHYKTTYRYYGDIGNITLLRRTCIICWRYRAVMAFKGITKKLYKYGVVEKVFPILWSVTWNSFLCNVEPLYQACWFNYYNKKNVFGSELLAFFGSVSQKYWNTPWN